MTQQEIDSIQKVLSYNRRIFLSYNSFRKKILSERAPKDSTSLLYLLPWLLSVNEPTCPGYVRDLKRPFRVFNIEFDKEIKLREPEFKKTFGITRKGTLLGPAQNVNLIQGIYTIGSVGTISQNSTSDCDIWICFDKKGYDRTAWIQLNQKINLIKGWMDNKLQIPVYFFICDIDAVKEGRFGSVDAESSGSTQQNVLKEEFYRTFILISGKIPIWWLIFSKTVKFDYEDALSVIDLDSFWEYDLIDLGNLEKINSTEYFGAALWQFHKYLTSPLKSIIKMVLLKMLLEAPQEQLLCHQLREAVLTNGDDDLFPDHSLFTMSTVLDNYKGRKKEMMSFIKMCFYLKCELNPQDRKQTLKGKLTRAFLNQYPFENGTIKSLQTFDSWKYDEQIDFGTRLYRFMLQLYREISADHESVSSESDKRDLTVLGRKISACFLKKQHKMPIIQKTTQGLNISSLTLSLNGDQWMTFPGDETTSALFSSENIIENISFIVWNGLFMESWIRMRPNPTSMTLKEIINLGKRVKDFFGTFRTHEVELPSYLEEEQIEKILVVIGFDKTPWDEQTGNYTVVYLNNWGELFTQQFDSKEKIEAFLRSSCKDKNDVLISKYLRRDPASFEKNIAIPKKIVFSTIKI